MSASSIQFSLPFCRGNSSEEKVDCSYYAKIATFAIGVILLVGGIIALSGAFGSLGGEIDSSLVALGIVALAISCVLCANKKDNLNNTDNYSPISIVPPSRNDHLSSWPSWQDDHTFSHRTHSNPFSVSHVGNSSHSSSKQKNAQSDNPHFKQAERYLEQGDLAGALKEIKQIYGEYEITEPFIARLARNYAISGKKEQAFKTIKEIIHNNDIKETFLAELAQSYLTDGNKEQAFTTIKEIVHNNEIKEAFLLKLAQAYLTDGNKEQAFKTIKEIVHNKESKEAFLLKLAQAYLTDGNKEQAFKTIKEIVHNTGSQEAFLLKLAQAYLAEGNKEQALATIKEIVHDRGTKEAFLAKLAQAYFNDENESGVCQIIEEVVRTTLINGSLERYRDKWFATMKRNNGNNKLRDFYARVAQECYYEVKSYFERGEFATALTQSKTKVLSDKYLQEYLAL